MFRSFPSKKEPERRFYARQRSTLTAILISVASIILFGVLKTPFIYRLVFEGGPEGFFLLGLIGVVLAPLAATVVLSRWLSKREILRARRDRERFTSELIVHMALHDKEDAPFTLYLRPFYVDGQLKLFSGLEWQVIADHNPRLMEDLVSDTLDQFGTMLAIGGTENQRNHVQLSTTDADWRLLFERLAKSASAIVVVPLPQKSVFWEVEQLFKLGVLGKTLFVVPPRNQRIKTDMFRRKQKSCIRLYIDTVEHFRDQGIEFPAFDRWGGLFTMGENGRPSKVAKFEWKKEWFPRNFKVSLTDLLNLQNQSEIIKTNQVELLDPETAEAVATERSTRFLGTILAAAVTGAVALLTFFKAAQTSSGKLVVFDNPPGEPPVRVGLPLIDAEGAAVLAVLFLLTCFIFGRGCLRDKELVTRYGLPDASEARVWFLPYLTKWGVRMWFLRMATFLTGIAGVLCLALIFAPVPSSLTPAAMGRSVCRMLFPDQEGVAIYSVDQGSQAQKIGLEAGDVVFQINEVDVQSVKQFTEELRRGGPTRLDFYRDGMRWYAIPFVAPNSPSWRLGILIGWDEVHRHQACIP